MNILSHCVEETITGLWYHPSLTFAIITSYQNSIDVLSEFDNIALLWQHLSEFIQVGQG